VVYDRRLGAALNRIVSIAVVLIALTSCGHSGEATQFSGSTMGTTYQVTYVSDKAAPRQETIDELLKRINQSMSTYIPSSTISQINASTEPSKWFSIDDHFNAVFRRSRAIYEDTDGTFNPAVGPLVNAWGFGPPGAQPLPDDATIRSLMTVVSFDAFELRDSAPSVRKKIPGAQLDFGGIAKGYAVDAIAALLEQAGVNDYLVQISGEVRAKGQRSPGRAWHVGIEKPANNAIAEQTIETVLALQNAALATSGNTRNYRSEGGKTFGHILNPKTGYPVENSLLSATVVAPDAMTADAYATALVVMGLDEALKFVESHKELQAYFIAKDNDGNIIEKKSSGFPD
jgi:thiamine biosynthesis lipoprotein